MPKRKEPTLTQSQKFVEAAQQLGCDNDESAFDEIVKKVAKAPPPRHEMEKQPAPERKKKK